MPPRPRRRRMERRRSMTILTGDPDELSATSDDSGDGEAMTPFEKSKVYRALCDGGADQEERVKKALRARRHLNLQLLNYKDKCNTFLHLAVLKHCDADGIERLVTAGAPVAHRNTDRENFMDLVLSTDYPHKLAVSRFVSKYVMSALKQGNADVIKELLQDTWSHWPIRGLEAIDKFSEAPEYLQHADLKQNGSAFRLTDSHEHAIHNIAQAIQQLVAVVARGGTETSLDDVINVQQYKATDVMGRTPLHYVCSQAQHDDKEALRSIVKRLDLQDTKDKKGLTATDYLDGKASIKVSALSDMLRHCERAQIYTSKINDVNAPFLDQTQSSPNTAGNDTTTKKVARDILDAHPWLATFNDVTGRNMTHKAVIFGQHNLLSLILDRDVDGEARQSRDTWGRTAYHYAYMFKDTTAIGLLERVKSKKDEQFVKTAKSHDYDGKDAASYGQLDAATAQTQQEHLQKTLRLMMAHASDAQGTQAPWIRHLQSGFTPAHLALLQSDKTAAKRILDQLPEAFTDRHITDVFGKRPLDYLELGDVTGVEQEQNFKALLVGNQTEPFRRKTHLDFITDAMIQTQLQLASPPAADSNSSGCFKLHTVINPDRPSTAQYQQLLKEQTTQPAKVTQNKNRSQEPEVNKNVNKQADDNGMAADDSPFDAQYLKTVLGDTLSEAMCIVVQMRPADPIEFLAQYLHNHARNLANQERNQKEATQLRVELETVEAETLLQRRLTTEQEELKQQQQQQRAEAEKLRQQTPGQLAVVNEVTS